MGGIGKDSARYCLLPERVPKSQLISLSHRDGSADFLIPFQKRGRSIQCVPRKGFGSAAVTLYTLSIYPFFTHSADPNLFLGTHCISSQYLYIILLIQFEL